MDTFDPSAQHLRIESKIVAALERISEAFRVLLWQEGKQHGLTPIQIQLLLFLRFHAPALCKVNYLAKEFNVTKATISESIRILTKKGFIFKETDPADTRSFTIHLTDIGKEMVSRTSAFATAIDKPVQGLTQFQKEQLFQNLLEIIKKLNKAGVVTVQRMCFSCRFYHRGPENDYCSLLKKTLHKPDLRVDCPEHELVAP
ncbi:MarR family winged helix-turn-helix transcriptional regulator [Spongiimicrobium sp. 2-473A-2-J]|uniref:MarR family winged helix-turn-helix transcriptional regulator n=1 Tax=Eudoraea algarum TaxID=3417568 RepID=UPI003D36C2A6